MPKFFKSKYESGTATSYLSQTQAIKRLQISLTNFRRLCILKGIYPVEPKSRKKAGKGNMAPKLFFYAKDIAFLANEPLLQVFRQLRIYTRKLKHLREKNDLDGEFRLRINKPRYTLQDIILERYPNPEDAVRDISDSLNLIFLFSRLPKSTQFHGALITLARRLSVEFMNFVVALQLVRRSFISLKGFYIEAEIDNIPVVWIIPHNTSTHTPSDVDYRTLATCLEFDASLVGSLLSNLYKKHGLSYPPKLATNVNSASGIDRIEYLSCLSYPIKRQETEMLTEDKQYLEEMENLQTIDDQVSLAVNRQVKIENIKRLFKGLKFYLNRETPREVLTLVIQSCGGQSSWDASLFVGAQYDEEDEGITHQIVDRPLKNPVPGRYYVQPQWVFDSLNAVRLMPVQDYMPGVKLPAHLSPFNLDVTEKGMTGEAVRAEIRKFVNPTTADVPHIGAGSFMYRPPEADYLAGLVSLAEIRGAPVVAQAEADDQGFEESGPEDSDEEEVSDGEELEEMETDTGAVQRKRPASDNSNAKKAKQAEAPKIPRDVKIIRKEKEKHLVKVEPGKKETQQDKDHREMVRKNSERKLTELSIPKKRKNLYRKMNYTIKKQNKDLNALKERRNSLTNKKQPMKETAKTK